MNHSFDIPDGWSPEVALAVSGVLAALESAIWSRYGDDMMPLITGVELPELEQVELLSPSCGEEHDRIPF